MHSKNSLCCRIAVCVPGATGSKPFHGLASESPKDALQHVADSQYTPKYKLD
jgi:hypothetical protein